MKIAHWLPNQTHVVTYIHRLHNHLPAHDQQRNVMLSQFLRNHWRVPWRGLCTKAACAGLCLVYGCVSFPPKDLHAYILVQTPHVMIPHLRAFLLGDSLLFVWHLRIQCEAVRLIRHCLDIYLATFEERTSCCASSMFRVPYEVPNDKQGK
jgi:hypothetical protein